MGLVTELQFLRVLRQLSFLLPSFLPSNVFPHSSFPSDCSCDCSRDSQDRRPRQNLRKGYLPRLRHRVRRKVQIRVGGPHGSCPSARAAPRAVSQVRPHGQAGGPLRLHGLGDPLSSPQCQDDQGQRQGRPPGRRAGPARQVLRGPRDSLHRCPRPQGFSTVERCGGAAGAVGAYPRRSHRLLQRGDKDDPLHYAERGGFYSVGFLHLYVVLPGGDVGQFLRRKNSDRRESGASDGISVPLEEPHQYGGSLVL